MNKSIKNVIVIIIFFFIIMVGYSAWNNSKQRVATKEFHKKKEAYEVIKDFMIKGIQENKLKDITIEYTNTKDNVWYYYFSSSDRKTFSESCDILDQSIIDSLDSLREIEETRFDFCGSGWYGKYKIISFVYDIEYAFDGRYNICWCEDIDILNLYMQGVHQFSLKKLGGNWYYVGFE